MIAFLFVLGHDFGSKIAGSTTHRLSDDDVILRYSLMVQETTYSQHGETVNRLGKSEISNFDDRRYVVCQQDVLWLEITMGDAFAVDVLQEI